MSKLNYLKIFIGLIFYIFSVNQVFAVVVAGASLLVEISTTGVSSGSSISEISSQSNEQVAHFIDEKLPHIESDLMIGNGQYLTTLSYLMDCDQVTQITNHAITYAHFIESDAYLEASDAEKSEELYRILKNKVAPSCGVIL